MGASEGKIKIQEGFGYRVIQIAQDSPGSVSGLELYLDFIIDINDTIEKKNYKSNETNNFFSIVNQHENKELSLTVYNMLKRQTRKIIIVPSNQWPNSDSLLGIMLRYEQYNTAHERTYRVLKVLQQSPAHQAGMIPLKDFVIGLAKYKYKDLNELIDLIVESEYSDLKGIHLILFNADDKMIRQIFLQPKIRWGGEGCLGCEFGDGFLNQIPTDYSKFQKQIEYVEAEALKKLQLQLEFPQSISNLMVQNNKALLEQYIKKKKPKKEEQHPHYSNPFNILNQEQLSKNNSNNNSQILSQPPPQDQQNQSNELKENEQNKKQQDLQKDIHANLPLRHQQQQSLNTKLNYPKPQLHRSQELEPQHKKQHSDNKLESEQLSGSNSAENDKNQITNKQLLKEIEEHNKIIKQNKVNDIPQNVESIRLERKLYKSKLKKEDQEILNQVYNQELYSSGDEQQQDLSMFSFYCKKINKEYTINSSDLFDLNARIESKSKYSWFQ